MLTNSYDILSKKIENIKNKVQISVTEIEFDDYGLLTKSDKSKLLSKIESIDREFFKELKTNINDCSEPTEEWDFNHCGGKNIFVYLKFQYSSEDEESVTYEYTIDGGGIVNTIEISKDHILNELNKGEEINDIIFSEIECNSF